MSAAKFLSRGIDHLGDLGAKLRDLQGFSTLAFELIQNADDVPKATSMTFSIYEDALIVDNDGIFSDCRQIEEEECPWKSAPARKHRCDFHRFRHIASGDKRGEAGTTGAFGIGFIAVYQITDIPELISAGRHWIIHEDRPESQRIEVCPGCAKCTARDLPGTRFILPWARDPKSKLRQGLQAEPVSKDAPQKLLDELERSLPIAMLFLKRLRVVEIKWSGDRYHAFQRMDEGESLILSDGDPNNDRIWHLIKGDFSVAAESLRDKHTGRIEEKRSAEVKIAIPATEHRTGLLCAYLPTQQDTGLPFHINADFFTTSDRKRLILAGDYQSAWNREAMGAAANAVGQSLGRLTTLLGPTRFWSFLSDLKQVANAERNEPTLAEFWKVVAPDLKTQKIIFTTAGKWMSAAESVLLLQKEESAAIPVFESMGMNVVHEDLRPYHSLLRSEMVGVPILDINLLCSALEDHGLTQRTEPVARPSFLAERADCEALWRHISLLLERQQRTYKAKAEDEKRLKNIALAPGRDGALWPFEQLYLDDKTTTSLFQSLGAEIQFTENEPEFEPLAYLCTKMDAAAAIQSLGKLGSIAMATAWKDGKLDLIKLFAWLENRREEILENPMVVKGIAELAIYPSSGELHRLGELALPGNFEDQLGLAELVDLSALGGRREFLRDLGMQELDFRNYAIRHLPEALDNSSVSPEKRRAAVTLLANRLGEIKDDKDVRIALAVTPLIECKDGQFRKAHNCYFENQTVCECLSDEVYVTVLPAEQQAAVRDLYEWLGVSSEPRIGDLINRIQALTSHSYTADVVQILGKIIAYLGKTVKEALPMQLDALKTMKWLPAKGRTDRWYRPNELYATYQEYLFDTQALFLDMPANIQNISRPLFELLGIKITPTANLVVKHLLYCAAKARQVHAEVYRFLNDKAEDPALNLLIDSRCLLLGDKYLTPSQVYWGEHQFGRYRRRLSEELRPFSKFLQRIGVRDAPDRNDALKVLNEIVQEFGSSNRILDEEAYSVLMTCWRTLENALNGDGAIMDRVMSLRNVKCIPNTTKVLNPPEWMFFENRAGLVAKFGDFLKGNVIMRPIGASTAMAVAGVRRLGSAVEVQLLECKNPIEDSTMKGQILERSSQFGRVLASQMPGEEALTALKRLANLQCEFASSLVIRYHLEAFNRERNSSPEDVPALYHRESDRLVFVINDSKVPWSAIARELAIALFPDEDPGRIAAGLKEVLAAESPDHAEATLDELGYARLDISIIEPVEPREPAVELGAKTPVSETGDMTSGYASNGGVPPMTPEEAITHLLGEKPPPPIPPSNGFREEPQPHNGQHGKGIQAKAGKKKTRPVLRSYVPAPGSLEASDKGGTQDSNQVDEAGIRRVLEYEQTKGRSPKEMPHTNPGYDIESCDSTGKIVRYIEVKSFSGLWNQTYAVLSRMQFDKASSLGDLYWLYVVERAESNDFKIHSIVNPAMKANHFMFDDGWTSMAEEFG